MGSGKTSWAIQHINEAPEQERFIYITPYLDEITRIKGSVTSRRFIEPNNRNHARKKMQSLKACIAAGDDIAATHSLFQTADDELIDLITGAGYTLILDEVMDVIEVASISREDIRILRDSGEIDVVDNRVVWIGEGYVEGRFSDIKYLAKAGNLFYHRGSFLIWTFPPAVFRAFDNVIVMTYLFDGQLQRYYYDLHGIKYDYKSVKLAEGERYCLTEYSRQDEGRAEILGLIDLYEGPMNDVGSASNSFSVGWLNNTKPERYAQIKRNLNNFLRNICDAAGHEILWTTKKDHRQKLSGKGYTKSFLHCNARATNEYADRWALAYVFNRYMHPHERAFFEDRDISVNQDLLAVSDLLQWVWRSRIRRGERIKLYIPSSRMRSLLVAWSEYKI
ncbi:hypothetical protein DET54_106230 [Paenibacillus pabuli]|uniref:Phage terminase large subunit n=1 Tax=Paenibacillus pabuli TaxID=1472 RepID=A0ABX9BKE8_9BACL|nr:hypothetical protein [Paenibacillus pabuli]RAI96872.1 hypothetical protein DET54_106230 [Paenibacillus pabuli]